MTNGEAVRTIDSGVLPTRFARGWHCLGLADSFRDGRPHAVEAFGTKLVVFADSAGTLHVLDGYCRHMGGDLTMGAIKGDEIACPFHDWRWRGDGRCSSVPYAHRVPPRARTRSWHACEENRHLLVWNDPQGAPPPPDIRVPRIEGAFSDEWSAWTWDSIRIDGANCREVIDNVVDMAHFFYIHFAFPTFFKNVFEGHVAAQFLETRPRPDVPVAARQSGDATLRSEAAYYGPAYMIDYLHTDYNGIEVESALVNCHYPVSANSFVLQWGIIVKQLPGLTIAQADRAAAKFAASIGIGFRQDVEIWKHKSRIDNPLLCAEDGPVYQLRRWYEQFYVDVEEVTEDMVARYEFEVDTTKAVETWTAEVAANLDRQPGTAS